MKTITHSAMTDFKNCKRKYYYRNHLKLVPRKEKPSLLLGRAVHKGLELYYQGNNIDGCIDAGIFILEDVDKSFWQQEDFDALEVNKAILTGMLKGYSLQFQDRGMFEVIEPEYQFTIPVINPATQFASKTFEHSGKIDGLFKTRSGQWWIREFKTASQIDKHYIDRLSLDTQITSYIDGVQAVKGIQIAGVIYTILKKPSIKQKQTETVEQYCQRVIQDYQERLDFYFHQETLYRDQNDLDEWRFEKWDIARDIADSEKNDRWYKNTAYCSQMGGCAYMPLCIKGSEALTFYREEEPNIELKEELKTDEYETCPF